MLHVRSAKSEGGSGPANLEFQRDDNRRARAEHHYMLDLSLVPMSVQYDGRQLHLANLALKEERLDRGLYNQRHRGEGGRYLGS